MRLFHVSEEDNINFFKPRNPTRTDLDAKTKLVWAIREDRLVNFLTPRDCPRVVFYAKNDSKKEDIDKFIGKNKVNAVIAIECGWFERMLKSTLYIYEFNPINFVLQDEIAGYYVSEEAEVPIGKEKIENLFSAIFERNTEVRILQNLWELSKEIAASSLGFSICRMRNAASEN